MKIDSLMLPTTRSIYYDTGFRAVLEDHMTLLRNHPNTQKVLLNTTDTGTMDAYRYEFDFYGLLDKYGVPKYLHWVVLRMMDFTSPNETDETLSYFLLPSESYLAQLEMAYKTVNKLS